MEKTRLKNTVRNNIENFNLNREIDLSIKNNSIEILNDRDFFNKFSNINEQLDMSNTKHDEFNYGMPVFNGQILNNKKSLISSPYILENNNKDNFISNNITLDMNDMYAEIELDNNKFDNNIFNNMAYNNKTQNNTNIETNENYLCKVEKDVMDFEYELNLNKQKEFLVDVNSPFALGFIWKAILLLTKNPSTDKLLKLLGVKNKDILISDMKYNSDVFIDYGDIQFIIPNSNQVINTNFISKIENIYKIKIIPSDSNSNVTINMNYVFNLEIPLYYQPTIISDYLLGYNKNKIKFISLTNVPISLTKEDSSNSVILEIPIASDMVLGFVYDGNRNNVKILPYNLMLETKIPNILVTKLIIPKINRNKKSSYGQRFKNELSNIHLGEVVYGMMHNIDININMGLNIIMSNEKNNKKYDIIKTFNVISINHKCYYYIKNTNIQNKILSNGMINY
jgi:hypothetical protein